MTSRKGGKKVVELARAAQGAFGEWDGTLGLLRSWVNNRVQLQNASRKYPVQ
jgi:hypothetical protein